MGIFQSKIKKKDSFREINIHRSREDFNSERIDHSSTSSTSSNSVPPQLLVDNKDYDKQHQEIDQGKEKDREKVQGKGKEKDTPDGQGQPLPQPGLQIYEKIGSGCMSIVRRGVYNGVEVAVKIVSNFTEDPQYSDDVEKHLQEVEILSGIRHINVVRYYAREIVDGVSNLILEYCEDNLKNLIENNYFTGDPDLILNCFRDIANGLYFLHVHHIVHRDIKPSNILLRGDSFKIADFSLAVRVNDRHSFVDPSGSCFYTSPEFQEKGDSMMGDIWSLGVVLLEMCWKDVSGKYLHTDRLEFEPVHYLHMLNEPMIVRLLKRIFVPYNSRINMREIILYLNEREFKVSPIKYIDLERIPVYAKQNNNLQLINMINQGGQGEVWRGMYKNYEVALKRVHLLEDSDMNLSQYNENAIAEFNREIDLHSLLKHKNIVNYIDKINLDGTLYLVTDLCKNSLYDDIYRNNMSEERKLQCFQDIAEGLYYLHMHGILHRDIKPQNILYQQGIYKITDLGLGQVMNKEGLNSYLPLDGTSTYIAPECWIEEKCSILSDIWSYGMVIYEVIFREIRSNADILSGLEILIEREGEFEKNLLRATLAPKEHRVSSMLSILARFQW